MPHAREFPRMRRPVVPLVRTRNAVVFELVADGRPRFPRVVAALHDLTKPSAGLRRVDAIRIDRRPFHMVDFPTREMRTADIPLLAFLVGGKDEAALTGSDEQTYSAHCAAFVTWSAKPCEVGRLRHPEAAHVKKVNTNDLEEFAWSSPKGKFAGFGKEISE